MIIIKTFLFGWLTTFNVNTFEIKGDSIIRKAELTGRRTIEINKDIVEKYGIDL